MRVGTARGGGKELGLDHVGLPKSLQGTCFLNSAGKPLQGSDWGQGPDVIGALLRRPPHPVLHSA